MRRLAAVCLASILMLPCGPVRSAEVHALLVGVTEYDALPEALDLVGPSTDIELMRETLQGHFSVPLQNIVILSQSNPRESRPTYANIVREFQALRDRVSPGDHVVILLSGHGSQDVDDDPSNPQDREADGLDEIFLPSDMSGWNASAGKVENAIRDDQLRSWLWQIRQRGAAVFFVSDSCHSDTQTRGSSADFKSRGIDLVPESILSAAVRRTRSIQSSGNAERLLDGAAAAGIVAVYAAQSHQETPDGFRDPVTGERQDAGLLTYTICRILRTTPEALTFRELGQRVLRDYREYRQLGVGADVPTPAMEGTDLDREVLGDAWHAGRSRVRFGRRNNLLFLTATRLDGLLAGTVLRLYPPAGEADADQASGWAVVQSATLRECIAVPVDYAEQTGQWTRLPNADHLPARGRCEIESASFGPLKLRLGVDDSDAMQPIRALLEKLAQRSNSFVSVDDSSDPRFHLRLNADHSKLVLERWDRSAALPQVSRFDLGPVDELTGDRLQAAIKHILRAESLRDIARQMRPEHAGTSRSANALNVAVTLERRRGASAWTSCEPASDIELRVGDEVRFRFDNKSRVPVRVTALYLGDDYRITPLFPVSAEMDNVLAAGGDKPASQYVTDAMPVAAITRALENLVVLVTRVEPRNDTANFNFLAQAPLQGLWLDAESEAADLQSATATQRGREQLTPLASALTSALFDTGSTRSGLGAPRIPQYAMSLVSWTSVEQVAELPEAKVARLVRESLQTKDMRPWRPGVARSKPRGLGESVYPQVAPAVVVVRTETGHGTGFFISADGWILTNHHVVNDCAVDPATGHRSASIHFGRLQEGWMRLSDQQLTADVYKWSEKVDLALLKIRELPDNQSAVPFIPFAPRSAGPSTDCVAIGHPASGVLWTVRSGEIAGAARFPHDMIDSVMAQLSASGRDRDELERQLDSMPQRDVVLSTCGLNPGDSGGPLVNAQGELVAVSFAIPRIDLDEAVSLDKFSYHVDLKEVNEFLAQRPTRPMIEQPTVWMDADRVRAADVTSDGTPDALLMLVGRSDQPAAILFDLDQDSDRSRLESAGSLDDLRSIWDPELAVHQGASLRVFYDTDNDGEFDLALTDNDHDGIADSRLVFSDGTWQSEPLQKDERASMFDKEHFQEQTAKTLGSALEDANQFLRSGGVTPKEAPARTNHDRR